MTLAKPILSHPGVRVLPASLWRISLYWMPLILAAVPLEAQTVPVQTMPVQTVPVPMQTFPTPTPTPRMRQQGTQIGLNGRSLPAAWIQWQAGGITRTGISDAGLLRHLGIELLNTTDASSQPIQWFSQPASQPLNLPTRRVAGVRYLDITDFAQQMGWQIQISGQQLQMTTPIAKVTGVRQGKQPWGDRLVMELDRPASWQVDQQTQELLLTVDAQIDPTVIQNFKPTAGNRIQSLTLEATAPNQTRLRLGIPSSLRPRLWSLPHPHRLVIDVRPDSMVDRDILWAAGLRWRSQILTLGTAQFPIVWLEVNPQQAGLRLRPILPHPSTMTGMAPLSQTAQVNQVAAAINGGFFNRNNQLPLGAIRREGRWLSGPILGRGAIAWSDRGEFIVGRLSLQETLLLPGGQRLSLTHLNSAFAQAGIARYTSDWGATYSPITGEETLVVVQNNQVVDQQPGTTPIAIPRDGYLLVLRNNRTAIPLLAKGTLLQLESRPSPAEFDRFPQILGAGPLLIQNRQIVLDAKAEQFSNAFIVETASRSAIGQTANGTILLLAVHRRVDGTAASLMDIAQIMQQLGAVHALNLDGGSSTTLYLGGQLLDRPPRTAARVHNGIGVFLLDSP